MTDRTTLVFPNKFVQKSLKALTQTKSKFLRAKRCNTTKPKYVLKIHSWYYTSLFLIHYFHIPTTETYVSAFKKHMFLSFICLHWSFNSVTWLTWQDLRKSLYMFNPSLSLDQFSTKQSSDKNSKQLTVWWWLQRIIPSWRSFSIKCRYLPLWQIFPDSRIYDNTMAQKVQ